MDNNYFSIHGYRLNWLLNLINSYKLPLGAKILDLGCYPDYLLEQLKKKGYNVQGVSSSFEKVNKKNVQILNLETDKLPYSDSSFDLIIFSEVLEHLGTGVESLFLEVSRCLKPGGHFVLTTPNVLRLHNIFSLILGKNIYFPLFQLKQHHNFRHQREYTFSEIVSLVPPKLSLLKTFYLAAYPPFRSKVKSEKLKTQIGKWFLYLLLLIFPRHRDTIVVVFTLV